MHVIAFDFETFYNNELSASPLGTRGYFQRLSLDDIYRVSFASTCGYEWVGHPKDADWSVLEGKIALAHNAGFEVEGVRRLRELGLVIPDPVELHDTADLAAFCGHPRSLKGASFSLFKSEVNKSIRDKDMKDKSWAQMDQDLREIVDSYALQDSRLTLKIWQTLSDKWPSDEREISRLSREWAAEGIHADTGAMDEAIAKLKNTIWEAERQLPWVVSGSESPLSKKALGLHCREVGITAPLSLAIGNEDCDRWMDEYGEKYPWVMAMRNWRRANTLVSKLESMKTRTIEGRLRYEIKYWGAGMTGRWSGAGGVNIQNMSGKDLFGVNMRDMLQASPGSSLITADLAQIEPRVACFLSGEKEALAQMAEGVSPYIVYARQAMGLGADEVWDKKDQRYKIAKISVLGASYCAGHHRFMELMKTTGMTDVLQSGPEQPDTLERYENYIEKIGNGEWIKRFREADEMERKCLMRSWEIIQTFRSGRPKLVALWKSLGELSKNSAERGEDLVLGLPSGRSLVYKHCRYRRVPREQGGGQEVVADIIRNGVPQTTRIHQGILIENLCQSLARDAFRDCLLAVHNGGHKIIFHVHDELVSEVDARFAEEAKDDILRLMGTPPKWAPSLPVEAEAHIAQKYSEAK
jgi:hypothetical protein